MWRGARRIVEIDGPQFHRDPAEDARKTAVWQADGWGVDRLPSDVPFDEPERLVLLVLTWARIVEVGARTSKSPGHRP